MTFLCGEIYLWLSCHKFCEIQADLVLDVTAEDVERAKIASHASEL